MFGLKSRSELVGLTYEQMAKLANWTEGQGEAFRQAELAIMTTGKPQFNVDEPPVVIDGQTRYYMSTKVPLYNTKGEITGVVGISTDITERVLTEEREKIAITQAAEEQARAEAETELRRAVTVLTGSIAHDLRTPISVMNIRGDIIQQHLPVLIDAYHKAKEAGFLLQNDIMKKHLEALEHIGEDIKETSKEMHEFIDITLKTLSKALKGELVQEDLTLCSMWHCIHNTLARYPFLEEKHKLVKWDRRDFNFMGNGLLMIRILSNLLNNSLQQIEKNQRGVIFISTEKSNTENIIRFKDTAGGAAPEIVEHLFDGYRTTKNKGTGIGLAFCKITMKSFGGDLECHSVEGDFIEFVLTLPKLSDEGISAE
jgi:signal transduction histidine kinase